MLFSMMITLAIMSCVLELMIAAKIPVWRKLSAKSKLFNLLNSLLISFIMGLAFGASGLIAMGSGVISTVISVPGYAFLHWAYDSPQAQKRGGNQIEYYTKRWKQALADLAQLTYKIIRCITFPIWATRAAILKFNTIKSKLTKA